MSQEYYLSGELVFKNRKELEYFIRIAGIPMNYPNLAWETLSIKFNNADDESAYPFTSLAVIRTLECYILKTDGSSKLIAYSEDFGFDVCTFFGKRFERYFGFNSLTRYLGRARMFSLFTSKREFDYLMNVFKFGGTKLEVLREMVEEDMKNISPFKNKNK